VSGLINIAFGVRLLAHPFEGVLAIALLLGALVFAVGARMIAGGVGVSLARSRAKVNGHEDHSDIPLPRATVLAFPFGIARL